MRSRRFPTWLVGWVRSADIPVRSSFRSLDNPKKLTDYSYAPHCCEQECPRAELHSASRSQRFPTWLVFCVFGVVCGILAVREASPQPKSPYTRYQHAAWYIYHIAQYTEWPKETFPDESAPFVLAILGDDPFHENIDVIKTKTIKNRKLVIRYCKTVAEIHPCQALYICDSEKDRLPQIINALENFSILTFSECEGFIPQGGMVKFWIAQTTSTEGFLLFQINQAATEKARLRVNSRVLKLSKPEKKQN